MTKNVEQHGNMKQIKQQKNSQQEFSGNIGATSTQLRVTTVNY